MTIETENQKSVKGRIVAAAWQLLYELICPEHPRVPSIITLIQRTSF